MEQTRRSKISDKIETALICPHGVFWRSDYEYCSHNNYGDCDLCSVTELCKDCRDTMALPDKKLDDYWCQICGVGPRMHTTAEHQCSLLIPAVSHPTAPKIDDQLSSKGKLAKDWDSWFLGLARYISSRSKDPSTKVGAVIVDADKRVVSIGYNGFPRGVNDAPERLNDRTTRYAMTLHAEANAILFARGPLKGCTVYTAPFQPCSSCAGMIIQVGITRCVSPTVPDDLRERWAANLDIAATMLKEAGVVLDLLV